MFYKDKAKQRSVYLRRLTSLYSRDKRSSLLQGLSRFYGNYRLG